MSDSPPCSGVATLQHEEQREKLRIVRTVLEQGGTFSGINRKVQLKPTKWSRRSNSSKPGDAPAADAADASQPDAAAAACAAAGSATANGSESRGRSSSTGGGGSSGGAAEKPAGKEKGEKEKGGDEPVVSELLLILKYGGVLTHAGRSQAEDLGKMFRMIMYPRWAERCAVVCRERSCFVRACNDRCSHELVVVERFATVP
jgi:hypothetical protein